MAAAREPARIVMVTDNRESATARRLQAELRGCGIDVVAVAPGPELTTNKRALEQVAQTERAFAAVWIVPLGSTMEIWIADRIRGKTAREFVASGDDSGSRDDTIALGTVEILRASLLAVSVEPEPRHGDPSLPPSVKRLMKSHRHSSGTGRLPTLGIAVGPAVDLGIGGVGPSGGPELGLRWQSAGAWGLQSLLATTVFPGSVPGRVQDQPASASVLLHRGGLAVTWSPLEGPLVPLVALGLSLVRFEARGSVNLPKDQAAVPIQGKKTGVWTLGPYFAYGLGYNLGHRVRLRADAGLLVTRRCTLRFIGNEVARWGEPALLGSITFEVLIPRTPE